MLTPNLPKICKTVINFFEESIERASKEVKFVKRKSKITANLFVQVLLLGCLSDIGISLERMCGLLKQKKISSTKQGLHQRFNAQAVELMKQLLMEATKQFKEENKNVIELLKPFSTVKILDSSGIELPSSLKDIYKGFGGSASEAALKMQVLFNYVEGQIEDITLTESRKNDQSFKEHLNHIEKGSLYLQDLGYFNVKSFAKINDGQAYFISRYLSHTKTFELNGQPFDLLKGLQEAGPNFKKEILLGQEEKAVVRMVGSRLPEEEIQKRLRKLYSQARKKGKTPTKETLQFAEWSLYVTNVPENYLSDEHIHRVYALRWQIELFFKLCKSAAGVDKTNGTKPYRVQCELYAKIICIIILTYICIPLRWQEKQEISFYKAYKQLQQGFADFFKALSSYYLMLKFLKNFSNNAVCFALKDRYRKKRQATFQKLMDATGQEVLV